MIDSDKQAKAIGVALQQIEQLLRLLPLVPVAGAGDSEARNDAAYYLRQAKAALADVGDRV